MDMSKLTNGITKQLKAKEYNDKYRALHKERIKQRQIRYREENKEFIKERKKMSYLKTKGSRSSIQYLFLGTRTRANRRKWDFTITVEFLENLWNKQKGLCYYSNLSMEQSYGKKNPFQMSVDRRDSSIGYTEENTVLCCLSINFAKNSFTEEELKQFLQALK